MKTTLTIFIVLLFGTCTQKDKQVDDSSNSEKLENKYFRETFSCNDSLKLVVNTEYLNVEDSVSPYMPLILNQKLDFHVNGIKINSISYPFYTTDIKLGDRTIMANNTTICKVACLQNGQNQVIYKINGSYNFDPPHEFFGISSTKGEWLWHYYGSMNEVYQTYGSKEKYIKEFGASEINNLRNMKIVCPEK